MGESLEYSRLFLIRPSAWALFSGALAAAAINLFTGLLSRSFGRRDTIVAFVALLLLAAAAVFGLLSVRLEELRETAGSLAELKRILRSERTRNQLIRLTLLASSLLLIGLLVLLLY
jgi:MFS family permease